LQSAGTTAITVDTSQNVGIGGTPSKKLQVTSSDVTDGIRLYSSDTGGEGLSLEWMSGFGSNRITADIESDASGGGGNFAIRVADTSAVLQTRLLIDNSGNLLVGTTSLLASERLNTTASQSTSYISIINNTASSFTGSGARGLFIQYTASPNSTSNAFWDCYDTTGTVRRGGLMSNGGLANYSANNVNLASDLRLKHDIEPVKSYWNVFKSLEWKTWLYNDQTDDIKNIGVIAQDLQALAPELVCESGAKETPEGETPYLGLWENDFKMAAMSVITELIKRCDTQAETINALTARITALENA
jgi:hypothetical protein